MFKSYELKVIDPWMTFDPICWGHMWLYPRIIVTKSRENISKYVDTVTILPKTIEPKVIDPQWPLTESLLKSHVWLYPRIIVSKSHESK